MSTRIPRDRPAERRTTKATYVTPEMISAGAAALLYELPEEPALAFSLFPQDAEQVVVAVYEAMLTKRPAIPPHGSRHPSGGPGGQPHGHTRQGQETRRVGIAKT